MPLRSSSPGNVDLLDRVRTILRPGAVAARLRAGARQRHLGGARADDDRGRREPAAVLDAARRAGIRPKPSIRAPAAESVVRAPVRTSIATRRDVVTAPPLAVILSAQTVVGETQRGVT